MTTLRNLRGLTAAEIQQLEQTAKLEQLQKDMQKLVDGYGASNQTYTDTVQGKPAHHFVPLQHHHSEKMESQVIQITDISIRIKQIMLDLYKAQSDLHDPKSPANPYYAKVVVANLIRMGTISSRHADKHKMPLELITMTRAKIKYLRDEMINLNGGARNATNALGAIISLEKHLQITLDEILYNDHFLFELMNELMVKVELPQSRGIVNGTEIFKQVPMSVHQAAYEVRSVLRGAKPTYLADDEYYQDRLKSLNLGTASVNSTGRFLSSLEIDYALDKLRLEAVDSLVGGGYQIWEAFDIVCQSEGSYLHQIVTDAIAHKAKTTPRTNEVGPSPVVVEEDNFEKNKRKHDKEHQAAMEKEIKEQEARDEASRAQRKKDEAILAEQSERAKKDEARILAEQKKQAELSKFDAEFVAKVNADRKTLFHFNKLAYTASDVAWNVGALMAVLGVLFCLRKPIMYVRQQLVNKCLTDKAHSKKTDRDDEKQSLLERGIESRASVATAPQAIFSPKGRTPRSAPGSRRTLEETSRLPSPLNSRYAG